MDNSSRSRPPLADVDFDLTPFTVAWEITRACALACVHCRAEAQPRRDPRELTTEEGFRLIDELVEVGGPILIITGGDPMMRPDLFDFIRYAAERGLRVALSPTATALVTPERLQEARDAGVARVQISLDGSRPEMQDVFRGRDGSFQRTVEILETVRDLGVSLQVGTTVSRYNLDDLAGHRRRGGALRRRDVEPLLPRADRPRQGRGHDLAGGARAGLQLAVRPVEERALRRAHDGGPALPAGGHPAPPPGGSGERERAGGALMVTGAGYSFADGLGQSGKGVNDGNGFAFVSHTGDVCPSGFLPLAAGNVREQSFVEIYRNSPLFRELRDYGRLKGKCGLCDFRDVCGGSRARAFAVTGDYMESDPYCVYIPPAARRGRRQTEAPHAT